MPQVCLALSMGVDYQPINLRLWHKRYSFQQETHEKNHESAQSAGTLLALFMTWQADGLLKVR